MGRKSRERRQKAKQRAVSPQTRIQNRSFSGRVWNPLKSKPVRKIATYAAIGGLAFGMGKFVERRLPYWMMAEARYSASLGFGRHDIKLAASNLVNEIKEARQTGKPFHLLLGENYEVNEQNFNQKIIDIKNSTWGVKAFYDKLVREQKMPEVQALEAAKEWYRKNVPRGASEFNRELEVTAIANGLQIVPIEIHSMQLSQQYPAHINFMIQQQLKFNQMVQTNASLFELQKFEMGFSKNVLKMERQRNASIQQNLEKVFKRAIQAYPEFKKERQIRAIGHLGGAHSAVYFLYDHRNSKVRLDMVPSVKTYSLNGYIGTKVGSMRPFNSREAMLSAIGLAYVDPMLNKLVAEGRLKEADIIYQKALKLTQKDFETLNSLTQTEPNWNLLIP